MNHVGGDTGGATKSQSPLVRALWTNGISSLDLDTFQMKYVWDTGKEEISTGSSFWKKGYPRQRPYQGIFVMVGGPAGGNSYNHTWGTWNLDTPLSSLCEMKVNEPSGSSSDINTIENDDDGGNEMNISIG